jgi:hypothetical protein
LKRLVFLLGILVLGLAAHLVLRTGAAGLDTAQRTLTGCADAASGIEILTDWANLLSEAAPEEPAPAGDMTPFDCGIGEAWRHHVP